MSLRPVGYKTRVNNNNVSSGCEWKERHQDFFWERIFKQVTVSNSEMALYTFFSVAGGVGLPQIGSISRYIKQHFGE